MPDTNYNAAWRSKRADETSRDPIWSTEAAKAIGRNYNRILDDPDIGKEAKQGLQQEFPQQTPNCKNSDVAARYLSGLAKGANTTGIAKAIVGQSLGAALINVYQDHSEQGNNELKASLEIYQDWLCPYCKLAKEDTLLKVGQPERNDAGQTVGIIVTGKMDLEPIPK